jgi:hypothetical protein
MQSDPPVTGATLFRNVDHAAGARAVTGLGVHRSRLSTLLIDCRILRAPGGHLLCVIPQHSDDATFTKHAQIWE